MDHDEIEQRHVAHLYLQGKLTAEETARFEEHYLGCPACVERLREAESLRRGLSGLARAAPELFPGAVAASDPREAAQSPLPFSRPRPASVRRRTRLPAWAATLAAALVLASVPSFWLWQRLEETRQELRRARQASGERARGPQTGLALAFLSPLRSAASPGDSAPRIHLSTDLSQVVLALDLGPDAEGSYRLSLSRATEETVLWRSPDLVPSGDGQILVALPATFVAPGEYRLRAEAVSETSTPAPALFAFRIERREALPR
ncbi:MAG TPA: zf-HC2 domain-containing protein [Thermoanaerobaculia bacterium]|jgi:hypothetical protein